VRNASDMVRVTWAGIARPGQAENTFMSRHNLKGVAALLSFFSGSGPFLRHLTGDSDGLA